MRRPHRTHRTAPRFLLYFLPPVPLAILGLFAYACVETGNMPSVGEFVDGFAFALVIGYLYMGIPSVIFALAMLALERQRVRRWFRCLLAAVFGGLSGLLFPVLLFGFPEPVSLYFVILGALAGALTVLLADAVAASDERPASRRSEVLE